MWKHFTFVKFFNFGCISIIILKTFNISVRHILDLYTRFSIVNSLKTFYIKRRKTIFVVIGYAFSGYKWALFKQIYMLRPGFDRGGTGRGYPLPTGPEKRTPPQGFLEVLIIPLKEIFS